MKMKIKQKHKITVGMFGTCGDSQWRRPFITHCNKVNVDYFNPVVQDWNEQCAKIEAEHLVQDEIILFPVTGETYGEGSLAETGLSIAQALRANNERFVVICIIPKVHKKLAKENPDKAKTSNAMRTLVLAHTRRNLQQYPNVYIVDSMCKMLSVTKELIKAMKVIKKVRAICINNTD